MASRHRPLVPGDGSPRHGKVTGYSRYGCKCEACREANAAYHRAYRAARKAVKAAKGAEGAKPGGEAAAS